MSKWIGILDPSVITVGMLCRTCLDYDTPLTGEDEDEPDDSDWFDGKVVNVSRSRMSSGNLDSPMGYLVVIERGIRDSSLWNIFLYEDNVEYFEIKLNAWDD